MKEDLTSWLKERSCWQVVNLVQTDGSIKRKKTFGNHNNHLSYRFEIIAIVYYYSNELNKISLVMSFRDYLKCQC